MTPVRRPALDRVIADLPKTYRGPGGAVAVLKEGEVLARRTWGFANAEQRIPFTPTTLFRICSITKQFVCALLLDAYLDPHALDARLRSLLPVLDEPAPNILHLCHNQSGLRDFWALAMLQGACAQSPYADRDAHALYAGTRSLQFRPGARFSYANQNFRLLADLLGDAADEDVGGLLRRRVFDVAGLASAIYAPDSRALPDGTEGYEGDAASGFWPAVNNIRLGGDGAIAASLDDMIAWERRIDSDRDDPDSLTGRLMAPVRFADGRPASYGFGLSRRIERGLSWWGHGGALRGWRSQRLYVPEERLSVVVMFNHMSDPLAAALEIAFAATGVEADARPPRPASAETIQDGAYLDPEARLLARIETLPEGRIRLRYGQVPEVLHPAPEGAHNALTQITPSLGGLRMSRQGDNAEIELSPCRGTPRLDIAGSYACAELASELEIVEAGGVHFGAFAGSLGAGRLEQLVPVGEDVWTLPCPRALDHFPPGDWTLVVRRGSDGKPAAISVGCWLARGLDYVRTRSRP